MGYDIYVVARSLKLKRKMLRFMRKHYVPWNELTEQEHNYTSPVQDWRDLCATSSKLALGCHYGPVMGAERDYCYAIVRWMALKIGTKAINFRKHGETGPKISSTEPVPYYSYDGCEKCPVITEAKGLGKTVRQVDQYGLEKTAYSYYTLIAGRNAAEYNKAKTIKVDGKAYKVWPLTAAFCRKHGLPKGSHEGSPEAEPVFEKLGKKAHREQLKPVRDAMKRLDELWEATL